MKRIRLFVVLLFALASIAPWTGFAAETSGECPETYCSEDKQCPGGECYKELGQSCGVCIY